jgi:hypothetical protein
VTEPPLPREARGRWWLWPALLLLLALPSVTAAGVLAGALAVRVAASAARRALSARAERARVATAEANGAFVLGVDRAGRAAMLGDRELAAHGLVLGASGAGKSTTLLRILTERIRGGHPVVAIDLKGSPGFARELLDAADTGGRRFRVWTPDGPERWNPLAHGNATELKDKLIATERFTEPHYRRAAERYVQLALQVLEQLAPDRPPTLAAVVELLEPRRLAVAARRLAPERRDRVRDYLASLAPDQLSAVRGLASRLAIITESHTGQFLDPPAAGPPAIDLRTALAGGEVVLFSLNSSTYGSLAAQLGTLAVQDLVSAAGHRLDAGLAPPATVAIDEFSALGSDNLIALLARGREAGIGVLLATQELADLDRAARGLRDQVLGNTSVKIAHRQDVSESAEAIARLAGTERVWERSYRVDRGSLAASRARGGTLRQVERLTVDPNRIRTLGTGEALVIVKSPRPSTRVTRVLPPARPGGPVRD